MFEQLNIDIDTLLDIRSYLIDKSNEDNEMFNYYQIEIGIIDFLLIKRCNEIDKRTCERLECGN